MNPRVPWAAARARAPLPVLPPPAAPRPVQTTTTTPTPTATTRRLPPATMSDVAHEHAGWTPYDQQQQHEQHQHQHFHRPREDMHSQQQQQHQHPGAYPYPQHACVAEQQQFPTFEQAPRSFAGAVPLSPHATAPHPASPSGASSAAYGDNSAAGDAASRKRAWDDGMDGSARAGDDGQARMRPPPGAFLRPPMPASHSDDRFFAQGGARAGEGEVPPTPESAGYLSQSPYYSSSSEAASRSPTTLPLYAYDRASSHASSGHYPTYPSSRSAHDASHPPVPSALLHIYAPPASYSPPPSNVLAPYQQEHPQPFPTTLPPVSVPPSTWATQRTQAYDMPPIHSPAFRPSTMGGAEAPLQRPPLHPPTPSGLSSYPGCPPSSLPPSSRASFSGAPFAYSADPSAYPPRRAGLPSYLEAPSYPLQPQSRPVTTSSLPSMSMSAPATAGGPYSPYHHEPQLTAYPTNGAASIGPYPSTSTSQHPSATNGYLPPPMHSASWAAQMPDVQDSSAYPAQPRKPPSPPPTILPETLPQLQQASTARAIHRSSAPVLAFNPAREPASTGKQLVQSSYGVTYAVAASGSSKGKAKSAEVGAVCYTCGKHRAKVILRGSDLSGWAPRLNYSCLDCLPIDDPKRRESDPSARRERLAERAYEADRAAEGDGGDQSPTTSVASGATSGSALLATLPGPTEHDRATFKDTFSGAVDYIEGAPGQQAPGAGPYGPNAADEGDSRLRLPPEETSRGLPAHLKRQALVCDVCDRTIGAGSISSLTQGAPPAFTVEVICNNCADKYKPCSDCGGGGGRLTPGRWRCKELFPAGRRTCTLSHARNPPLSDIDYDVLRVTEIDPRKFEALEARCRLVYFNTRMRTQARPEMLERGDGLATTYAQCEKLVVDGWSLLSPLMHVDVEASRGIRRYVAVQTSTPHRRRAKPKPGAAPRPEPELEDPLEKEVSGFLLVEHDLENGATFIAVTMPWAISGDAFDATTILIDETIKRVRSDLRQDNAVRREHGEAPYPEPWCLWGVTPFKADSRMTQSLSRRSFIFLEEYMRDKPDTDLSIFPPTREIHIPNEFVKTFKIFIRDMTEDDGNGLPASVSGSAASAAAKKAPRQRARKLKAK
ncbi:hypothetical protein JCM3770_001333 [Rhodotorula araucariae]